MSRWLSGCLKGRGGQQEERGEGWFRPVENVLREGQKGNERTGNVKIGYK